MSRLLRPMRRSSLLGPWGVGAIVPFPNDETLMIAGLDRWRYPDDPKEFVIKDERLTRRLGVSELRWPPDFRERSEDPENAYLKIPAVRFPRWHYCPFCGYMTKTSYYANQPRCIAPKWGRGRTCSTKGRLMIPERFIVACEHGHVDDFPIIEWIHRNSDKDYNPDTCRIRRSTGGTSSSLGGVFYECTCGARRSLIGAMNIGSLASIGYTCRASMPWFGRDNRWGGTCEAEPEKIRVLLRGATNVWFGNIVSSIHIPTDIKNVSRKVLQTVERYYDSFISRKVDDDFDRTFVEIIAEMENVDFELLYNAFLEKYNKDALVEDVEETTTEEEYRLTEYQILKESSGSDSVSFHSVNNKISEFDESIHEFFDSISLVHKLKETRALVGFTRLEPRDQSVRAGKKMLSVRKATWLPAVETNGEGIFFEFNSERLENWARDERVLERMRRLGDSYKASFTSRWKEGELSPQFVLIHTFAHLLINQLSFECGYGSSSIRERIYCEENGDTFNMQGVLLYTASGDSDGSLGGLVRQGKPGRIEDTINSALKNALWCSSDPVCIQSLGQGTDSCNLAACHNCALLPETCCENGNKLLDRGVVIGTLDDPDLGFFSSIREKW